MNPATKEHFSELERRVRETDQRVGAFISRDWVDAEASALVGEIANLTESIRLSEIDTSIPKAAIVQQQRVLTRASEALAEHRQKLSLSRSFSFKRRGPAPPPGSAVGTPCKVGADNAHGFTSSKKEELPSGRTPETPKNVLCISGLSGEVLFVGPGWTAGREVWLRSLESCTVYVVDRIPCARLHNIRNSAVMLLQVASAAYLERCSKCLFAVYAQQLRVHDCLDVSFFLNTASSPIIEGTSEAVFAAPICSLQIEDEDLQAPELARSDAWRQVKDFGWIKRQQSPNWRLLGGPEPRVLPLRCVRLPGDSEVPQGGEDSSESDYRAMSRTYDNHASEVTCRSWRLDGPPCEFSACGLAQHSTAAEAAAAIAARFSKQPQQQPPAPSGCRSAADEL